MFVKTLTTRPSATGIVLGTVLMALSLTPSLIPRTWIVQGAIAALAFVCGYAIVVGLAALWRYLELPTLAPRTEARLAWVLLAAAALVLVYALMRALPWQNNVRQTVGLDPVDSAYPMRTVLLAVTLAAVLILVARLIWWLVQVIVRIVNRYIPRRVGQVLGAAIAIVVVIMLLNGLLVDTISSALNSTYALRDNETYANTTMPTSDLRSGGPNSLVAWNTLGREGRRFTATGPSSADIAAFWDGAGGMEPIRVYIGDKSAATLEERAELALQELVRTGAFERDVLVLVTSTGNGWVDANSVNALEYIFAGNTAIASFQYSYLPSVYSLLADKDAATDASLAMFNKIQGHWRTLDPDDRPDFYLYGLSLGAFGSQAAVSSVSQFNDPIDGALWAGPPFVSEFWRQITRDREAGTPIWLPVYQDGTTIRFTNTGANLQDAMEMWQDNRFVYLQQAGDPIVFFEPESLFREPEWLQEESRSPKAPTQMHWVPVVTFWQLIFDMVLATNDSIPDGNGHRYSSSAYIDAWVALATPANWGDAQTDALKTLFQNSGNLNIP